VRYVHEVSILSTNIVGIAHLSMAENVVNGRAVIFDIEPVTHVGTVAIYCDGLSLQTRMDNGRDKLLIVLIRAVVIGILPTYPFIITTTFSWVGNNSNQINYNLTSV